MANSLETCKHSKLDEIWGDYKCLKLQHRICDPLICKSCVSYEEDKDKKGGNTNER